MSQRLRAAQRLVRDVGQRTIELINTSVTLRANHAYDIDEETTVTRKKLEGYIVKLPRKLSMAGSQVKIDNEGEIQVVVLSSSLDPGDLKPDSLIALDGQAYQYEYEYPVVRRGFTTEHVLKLNQTVGQRSI